MIAFKTQQLASKVMETKISCSVDWYTSCSVHTDHPDLNSISVNGGWSVDKPGPD